MTTSQEAKVDTPSLAYQRMAERWKLIDDLTQGTEHIRELRTQYLPMFPGEEESKYRHRLQRTFLYSALRDSIEKTAATPFAEPVKLRSDVDLDPRVEAIERDVDGRRSSLTALAHRSFRAGVKYGKAYFWVDMPPAPPSNSALVTGAQRPRIMHLDARDVIDWVEDPADPAKPIEVRVRGESVVRVGAFGQKRQKWVRVYRASSVADEERALVVWEQWEFDDEANEYVFRFADTMAVQDIPIVQWFTGQDGAWTASPPYDRLADLNLKHYQRESDVDNALFHALIPILYERGYDEDGKDTPTVQAGAYRKSTNPQGDLKYVEHSGAAIGTGQTQLERIEERMIQQGLQPFFTRAASKRTATEVSSGEERQQSLIQQWIRNIEGGLLQAFRMVESWYRALGQSDFAIPDGFGVDVFDDFAVILGESSSDDMRALNEIGVSRRTMLEEAKRRGLLSEHVNVDDEIDRIDAEMPAPVEVVAPAGASAIEEVVPA